MSWKHDAEVEIRRRADLGEPFSADDVIEAVGYPDESHEPNAKNNSIGSLFQAASKAGKIEMVGTTQSKQKHRKGGLIRVWKGVSTNRLPL